jgi:hypothetical protein
MRAVLLRATGRNHRARLSHVLLKKVSETRTSFVHGANERLRKWSSRLNWVPAPRMKRAFIRCPAARRRGYKFPPRGPFKARLNKSGAKNFASRLQARSHYPLPRCGTAPALKRWSMRAADAVRWSSDSDRSVQTLLRRGISRELVGRRCLLRSTPPSGNIG